MHKSGSSLCSDYYPITFFIENKPILCFVYRHVSAPNHCPGLAGRPGSTVRLPPGHQPADEVAAHEPVPNSRRASAPEAVHSSTHAPHRAEVLHPHALLRARSHVACKVAAASCCVDHQVALLLLVTRWQHCWSRGVSTVVAVLVLAHPRMSAVTVADDDSASSSLSETHPFNKSAHELCG